MKPNDRALIHDPRQTDLEDFTATPTVVEVVSYYTCSECEHHWHVQLAQENGIMICPQCGEGNEPYETENVDV